MIGFGIDSLAIGICIEHGDDEEAVFRTVGVIAGAGLGAASKYADDVRRNLTWIKNEIYDCETKMKIQAKCSLQGE